MGILLISRFRLDSTKSGNFSCTYKIFCIFSFDEYLMKINKRVFKECLKCVYSSGQKKRNSQFFAKISATEHLIFMKFET